MPWVSRMSQRWHSWKRRGRGDLVLSSARVLANGEGCQKSVHQIDACLNTNQPASQSVSHPSVLKLWKMTKSWNKNRELNYNSTNTFPFDRIFCLSSFESNDILTAMPVSLVLFNTFLSSISNNNVLESHQPTQWIIEIRNAREKYGCPRHCLLYSCLVFADFLSVCLSVCRVSAGRQTDSRGLGSGGEDKANGEESKEVNFSSYFSRFCLYIWVFKNKNLN